MFFSLARIQQKFLGSHHKDPITTNCNCPYQIEAICCTSIFLDIEILRVHQWHCFGGSMFSEELIVMNRCVRPYCQNKSSYELRIKLRKNFLWKKFDIAMYLLAYLQLKKVQYKFIFWFIIWIIRLIRDKRMNFIYKTKKIIFETSKLMEKFNIQ